MTDEVQRSKPPLDISTKLAFERTRAAYERTMMAWIRTATSLITFGFSIYKFFQIEEIAGVRRHHVIGAREFALILVSMGLASLALAAVEYRQNLAVLDMQDEDNRRSLALILAALISLLGISALILMLYRQ